MATCSTCHGAGTITITQEDEETETAKDYTITCPACGGSGES
jgi:DnaJ-class molecular chaperone